MLPFWPGVRPIPLFRLEQQLECIIREQELKCALTILDKKILLLQNDPYISYASRNGHLIKDLYLRFVVSDLGQAPETNITKCSHTKLYNLI
jgi:hypothetical protein